MATIDIYQSSVTFIKNLALPYINAPVPTTSDNKEQMDCWDHNQILTFCSVKLFQT